jgi:hypothetical protein
VGINFFMGHEFNNISGNIKPFPCQGKGFVTYQNITFPGLTVAVGD